ncbi:MAG: hypothetical protein Q8P12_04570, partial [bacterium]|nr:hypothetical protein [bacterium]
NLPYGPQGVVLSLTDDDRPSVVFGGAWFRNREQRLIYGYLGGSNWVCFTVAYTNPPGPYRGPLDSSPSDATTSVLLHRRSGSGGAGRESLILYQPALDPSTQSGSSQATTNLIMITLLMDSNGNWSAETMSWETLDIDCENEFDAVLVPGPGSGPDEGVNPDETETLCIVFRDRVSGELKLRIISGEALPESGTRLYFE